MFEIKSLKKSDPSRKWHFVFQISAAVFLMALVLFLMSVGSNSQLLWALGAGSLASSIFIVFTLPQSLAAEPRRLIGAYCLAIVIGVLTHVFLMHLFHAVTAHFILQNLRVFWISSALAMGITMVLMIIFNCQHPPAAGVSIVLVLNIQEYTTVAVILFTAILLALINYFLKDYLINLSG